MTKLRITEEQSLQNWNEKYWARTAPQAGNNIAPSLQSHIGEAMAHLYKEDTRIVLEIPCGDGCNTVTLARSVPKVIAIDSSAQAIDLMQQTLFRRTLPHRRANNVMFQRGDVFRMGFFEKSFDGIFCWDLLSFLQRPERALGELRRVCRPGRRIVGSLCSMEDGGRGVQMVPLGNGKEYLTRDQCYVHYFNEAEARAMLKRQSGCDLIDFYPIRWSDTPDEEQESMAERAAWVFVLERQES